MTETVERTLSYLGEKPKKGKSRTKRNSVSGRAVELGGHLRLRAPQLSSRAVGRLAEKLAVSELVLLNVSHISERTFQRRKERQETLSEAESDRVLRIARIANEAERVFGDSVKARRWLSADNRTLGAKPLDLLATDAGAREVESELVRIDFGDFS